MENRQQAQNPAPMLSVFAVLHLHTINSVMPKQQNEADHVQLDLDFCYNAGMEVPEEGKPMSTAKGSRKR